MVKSSQEDRKRFLKLTLFERKAFARGFRVIAGIDEAGRGPLAGPIVACACTIGQGVHFKGINDSKKLTPKQRGELFQLLKTHPQVSFGVGIVSHHVIDEINIHQATLLAMKEALSKLNPQPDYLLVDGFGLSYQNLPCEKIIEGDSKSQSIAAASIIAKETRDGLMREYHREFPQYGFDEHKGYGTRKHLAAIIEHGLSKIHRRSFAPCKPELTPVKD